MLHVQNKDNTTTFITCPFGWKIRDECIGRPVPCDARCCRASLMSNSSFFVDLLTSTAAPQHQGYKTLWWAIKAAASRGIVSSSTAHDDKYKKAPGSWITSESFVSLPPSWTILCPATISRSHQQPRWKRPSTKWLCKILKRSFHRSVILCIQN